MLICLPAFISYAKVIKSHGYAIYSQLKYPENFDHFDYANPDAPKRGELRMSHIGSFSSVNANVLKGTKAPGLDYIYDSLLIKSMDELNSYYGLVAESIEYSSDLSYVIFNLRPQAKWHDGSNITAGDIIFTYNTLITRGDPSFRITLSDVSKVEKLNDYRIKYSFKGRNDPLQIAIIGELPILQKQFFQDKNFDQFDGIYPTSGPYQIKKFSYGKNISYERNKDYWARDFPVNKGLYNFDVINYDCYYDNNIAVEALKAGAFDYRNENITQIWNRAYRGKFFNQGKIIKDIRQHKLPAALQMFYLNTRKAILSDIALRKALFFAYDFDWLNQNLYYKLYRRIKSYFENTEYSAQGLPQGRELEILNQYKSQLPQELFTQKFIIPQTSSNPASNRNYLKIAKQILLEAGYKIVDEKMISPVTNKPVELEIIYRFQGFERAILAYKENLAKIGIALVPRLVDHGQYSVRMANFDYDLIISDFAPLTFPGRSISQFWHSNSDIKGSSNLSGIKNKLVDSLIDKLVESNSKDEVLAYAKALDRVLLWNYYTVPQFYSNSFKSVYWDKFGIPEVKPEYAIGIEAWWQK